MRRKGRWSRVEVEVEVEDVEDVLWSKTTVSGLRTTILNVQLGCQDMPV